MSAFGGKSRHSSVTQFVVAADEAEAMLKTLTELPVLYSRLLSMNHTTRIEATLSRVLKFALALRQLLQVVKGEPRSKYKAESN